MDKIVRDGFVMYASFFEAIENLDEEQFNKCMRAICKYGLYGDVPEEASGIVQTVFMLVKPQIDANNRRYLGGCKGGRPRKDQSEEANTEKKKRGRKPKQQYVPAEEPQEENYELNLDEASQEVAADPAAEVEEQKEDESKELKEYGEYNNVLLSDHDLELLRAKRSQEDIDAAIDRLDCYIESLSPSEKKKYRKKNHRMCMDNWVFDAIDDAKFKEQKRQQGSTQPQRVFQMPRSFNSFPQEERTSDEWAKFEAQVLEN